MFTENTEVCSKLLPWNAIVFVFKLLLNSNVFFTVFLLLRNIDQRISNEGIAGGKWVHYFLNLFYKNLFYKADGN